MVTPKNNGVEVDLRELVDELQVRMCLPHAIRFTDILDNRIEDMSRSFKSCPRSTAIRVKTSSFTH